MEYFISAWTKFDTIAMLLKFLLLIMLASIIICKQTIKKNFSIL